MDRDAIIAAVYERTGGPDTTMRGRRGVTIILADGDIIALTRVGTDYRMLVNMSAGKGHLCTVESSGRRVLCEPVKWPGDDGRLRIAVINPRGGVDYSLQGWVTVHPEDVVSVEDAP